MIVVSSVAAVLVPCVNSPAPVLRLWSLWRLPVGAQNVVDLWEVRLMVDFMCRVCGCCTCPQCRRCGTDAGCVCPKKQRMVG